MKQNQRDALVHFLHEDIVTVYFRKVNGEPRVMYCTLDPDYMEVSEEKTSTKTPNIDVQSVWDMEKNAWRSFRFDSVYRVEIPDKGVMVNYG